MRTYTTKEPYPAAVITLATPESNRQEILFQTRYDVQGYNTIQTTADINEGTQTDAATITNVTRELTKCSTLEWAIKSFSVSLYRDWSTSNARIVLTCSLNSPNQRIPSLPDVSKFRGGAQPYLSCDDEIRIYAGYVDSPTTQLTTDLLDEIPFPMVYDDGTPMEDMIQPDLLRGKLVPIFWGFIDKIDFDGSANGSGMQYILSCRDRGRVLSDTTLISVPSISGVFGDKGGNVTTKGALHQVVSDVAKAVNGFQLNVEDADVKDNICWKQIITPKLKNLSRITYTDKEARELERASKMCELYSAYEISNNQRVSSLLTKATEDPTIFCRRAAFKIMDFKARPRFHMWLNRPPLSKDKATAQWQVLDKSPMNIIKWIAIKEERPLDFYTSHTNGDFCLVPRVLDVSGFKDETRHYRTYFFRDYPKTCEPPCPGQLILGLRTFTTVIGTYNRFTIIDNSSTSGSKLSILESVTLTIDRLPFILQDRTVTPPCRTKLIYDGGLSTYANNNTYGAALIAAMSVSSQVSRDVSGAEFTILGDPTLFPSEAVRIYNSVLHDESQITQTGRYQDILSKQVEYDKFQEKYKDTPAAGAKFAGNTSVMKSAPEDNAVIAKLSNTGTMKTNKDNLNLPVYKIRSIQHTLSTNGSSAGFKSLIFASMDLDN
jgi:hypothetical protein